MRYWNCYRCGSQIPFDGKIKVIDGQVYHPNCPAKRPADLPEAGASAERISSVVRSNATNGWISVKDRLPDNLFIRCLVSIGNDRDIKIKEYDPLFWQSVNITHWMPLPEPPK